MQAEPSGLLRISASSARPQLLEMAFAELGALSVSVTPDGGELADLERPEKTCVSALFPAHRQPRQLILLLSDLLAPQNLAWHSERIADRDWVADWQAAQQPLQIGRLWICPRHTREQRRHAPSLYLDPGLAFGTGSHPTTALCLEWLDQHLAAGAEVLDYGCGSGIFALAALRLGAGAAQAVDIDRQALAATAANARHNRLENQLRVGPVESAQAADIVIANILARPLITLAPRLATLVRPGGWLILAGMLAHQAQAVQTAHEPDFRFAPGGQRQGWQRLDGQRQ